MQFNFVKFVIIELQLIFRHKARLKNGFPRTPKTSNPIGTVLERSWNGLETVFGTVLERSLERSWNGLGTVLERSWNVVGTVFETVLERYLERSWNGLGTVFAYMNVAQRWRICFTHSARTHCAARMYF